MKPMSRQTFGNDILRGFTILEVLIALTASLLLMLGLTRAFKLIGDSITSSQSELSLANSLREVTFRLRDEIGGITTTFSAPQSSTANAGYFTYYEGPWTDATTAIVNGRSTASSGIYFPTSRYGDLDDYVAFTTRSNNGSPFVGVIPAGIIEAIRYATHRRNGGTPATFRTSAGKTLAAYNLEDSVELVPFYSELAEVVYFVDPTWQRDELGIASVALPSDDAAFTSQPSFIDNVKESETSVPGSVGDNIPDRLSLRRRVLLIRNDLNLTYDEMTIANGSAQGVNDALRNRQLPFLDPGSKYIIPATSFSLPSGRPFSAGLWGATSPNPSSPDWLTGMARPLQWMDLSLSRVTSGNRPLDHAIKANSLNDLSNPENRFGFVRIPASLLGLGASIVSSMPVLALSQPHPFITQAQSATFAPPSGTPFSGGTGGQAMGGGPYSSFSMTGFFRPEYSLADHVRPWTATISSAAADRMRSLPTLRGGSDVVAEDVIAFDIQVFDPSAPVATFTSGATPVLIEPTSYGFRKVLENPILPNYAFENRGAYVDYAYCRLAGGVFGGVNPLLGTARFPTIVTKFSGVDQNPTSPTLALYPDGWFVSGRIVASQGAINGFFQPMIDTWSDIYDRDFLLNESPSSLGVFSILGSPGQNRQPAYLSTTEISSSGGNRFINGVNNAVNEAVPPSSTLKWKNSNAMPSAIRITLRVQDRVNGELRQLSLIEEFTDEL